MMYIILVGTYRRIDLADLVFLEHLDLSTYINLALASLFGFEQTLEVSAISLVGDPDALLRVIRLGLVFHLQLMADNEPGGGVRVGTGCLLDMARHVAGYLKHNEKKDRIWIILIYLFSGDLLLSLTC